MPKTPSNNRGLAPKNRPVTATKQANQWQATPQQNRFMNRWLNPKSDTFGNAYKSALAVGYSKSYAVQLSSPAVNNKWLQEYTRKLLLTDDHLKRLLAELAMNSPNSRSPDDTRVKALELLLKVSGALTDGKSTNVTVVTPILGGASITEADRVYIHNDSDSVTEASEPLKE